jgi:hypothetical protein
MPGVATQTNKYRGLVQKIHKGIDYVSSYLDSRVLKEKQREATERSRDRKRFRVRAYKPKQSRLSSFFL